MPTTVAPDVTGRIERLRRVMKADEPKLRKWREIRVEFLKQYCGQNYAGDPTIKPIPLNTLGGAVLSLGPHIVSANPKAGLTPKGKTSEAMGTMMEVHIDRWAAEQDFKKTLQACSVDAMFGMPVLWCGLAPGGKQVHGETSNYLEDSGVVAVDIISQDDFGFDTNSKRFSECFYQWHEVELPLEWVRTCGLYENTEGLRPGQQEWQEPTAKGRKLSSAGLEQSQERALDTIKLRIVWLPRGWSGFGSPLLVTLAPEGQGQAALSEVPYIGPRRGPYEPGSYHEVPDNIYPLPPAAIWYDLSMLVNKIARKMGNRASREKDITLVEEAGKEDGQRVKDANDGDIVAVKNVDRHQQVTFGGVKPGTLETITWLTGVFSKLSGNLDLIAGSSGGAKTLGQTEILLQNASGRVGWMQAAMAEVAKRVYEKVAWYMLQDPDVLPSVPWTVSDEDLETQFEGMPETLKEQIVQQYAGAQGTYQIALTPEMRQGLTLEDFQITVEPYTLTPDSPAKAGEKIVQFVQNVYAPLSQQLDAQGMTLDVADLLQRAAKLMNIRDIQFKPNAPGAPMGPMGGSQPRAPSMRVTMPGGGGGPAQPPREQQVAAGAA